MAVSELMASQNPAAVFRRYVLVNLSYWRAYIAVELKNTDALDRSYHRIVRAISFAIELDDAWPSVGELIEEFAAYMERRGYWEAWQWVLSQALTVAQRANDLPGIVKISALLARLALRQSRFKEAVFYHRSTIRTARRIGDRANEARACSNLGYFYIEQGHWRRAEMLCCHALVIFEQLDHQHGLAHTENHLGILYTRQSLCDKARQHLERACAIWQKMEDAHGLMYGYVNLGMLFTEMKQPDQTLFYLQKALDQAKLVGEEAITGTLYMNMGISYRLKGEFAQAEEFYWRAKAIFQRFSNLWGLAAIHDNLGLVYLDQRRWQEGSKHLETALELWYNLNNKHNEIRVLTYMVEYELARGNQQQARYWLKEAEQLLNQHDQTRQYSQLHARLEEFRRNLAQSTH